MNSFITGPPARPSQPAPGSRGPGNDGFEDIPPEMFDEIHGGHGGGGGTVTCPHCTFENMAGSTDCDVCGLPLSG